jgi:heme A synthase
MSLLARRPEADELARFRRLCGATIAATFALIVIGGVVRVSDAGLGCGPAGSGTHGWPLCEGRVLPFLEGTTAIEFSHRVAATIVGVLIVLMALQALRRLRERRSIVRGSLAAGALVLAQAVLGGVTVEEGLSEGLVAAHLGLAMLLLGLLVALRRLAAPAAESGAPAAPRALRALAAVSAVLVLATIVAGGWVAGTEGEGTASEPALGAHLACGEQFPGCIGEFMPFGTSRLIDIQLTHRALMYLAALSVLATVAVAIRRRVRPRTFALAAGLLVCQVLLGALNVWLGKHAGLIVAHLALGSLLWAAIVQAAASLVAVPQPAAGRARHPGAAPEAVTA